MNSFLKLSKQSRIIKNIFYNLKPIHVTPNVKCNMMRLCNNNTRFNYKYKSLPNVVLCSSLLTWLGFAKDDEERETELIMTIKRAILLTQRNELSKAEQMLHIALKLAQDQRNEQGILYVYDLMANLALERNEIDKAEKLFVNVFQKLLTNGVQQDDIKAIHISLKLARICHIRGNLEKAEVGFQWCLDSVNKKQINNTEHDQDWIALNGAIQDWYAQLLLDKGQINESLKHLKNAHKICSQLQGENSEKSILLLNDLGTASYRLGDLKTAENYLSQAIELGKHLDDFHDLGVIYANLGLVYLQKDLVNEAKKYCKEAWRLGKKQSNNDTLEQASFCFEQIDKHHS